jgi:hypothetical protein
MNEIQEAIAKARAQDAENLSKRMQVAVQWAKEHAGTFWRHPGGYWGSERFYDHHGVWFGTSTIEALVKRGVAEYSAWQEGRNGRFPIQAKLKDQSEPQEEQG